MRTPLAALKAEADWTLGRSRDAAAYREALETCSAAAARMAAIVESLLALAQADADEQPPQLQHLPLADVVRDAVALATRRGIRIDTDVDGVAVRADPARLRQALANVIWNAVQYNHDGGHVAVRAAREGGVLTLRVIDTGIGIAEDDLPHVFDRFYRADKARATVAGTGLGLALTKILIEQHAARSPAPVRRGEAPWLRSACRRREPIRYGRGCRADEHLAYFSITRSVPSALFNTKI